MPSILFVCTANRFRSPLAAARLRRLLDGRADADEWLVESAGTWAEPGQSVIPSPKWMSEHFDLDLSSHRSRRVEREMLSRSSLVLVMENSHLEALRVEFPESGPRISLLAQMAHGVAYDVPDPGVIPDETFLDIAREVTSLVDKGFENIRRLALQSSGA